MNGILEISCHDSLIWQANMACSEVYFLQSKTSVRSSELCSFLVLDINEEYHKTRFLSKVWKRPRETSSRLSVILLASREKAVYRLPSRWTGGSVIRFADIWGHKQLTQLTNPSKRWFRSDKPFDTLHMAHSISYHPQQNYDQVHRRIRFQV